MKSKILKTIAVGAMLATPLLVGAQGNTGGLGVGETGAAIDVNKMVGESGGVGKVTGIGGAFELIEIGVGYLVALFWILTVVFFILAAVNYVTAQGDEKKLTKAKSMVRYGIIGVVVALFSTAIRALIVNALGGN